MEMHDISIRNRLESDHASVPMTSSEGKISRTIEWDKMTAATLAHLVWHGLKQKANDGLGAKDMTAAEKIAKFNKSIDALEANELRATRTTDAYERELRQLAIAQAKKRVVKEGMKVTAELYKSDKFQAFVNEYKASENVQKLARSRADELELLEI